MAALRLELFLHSPMSRRRGSIARRDGGKLFARLTWKKPDGKRGSREQRVATKTEGWRVIDGWLRDIDSQGSRALERDKITFDVLADHVRDNYFIEPVERDGRRVSGVRTWKDRRATLEMTRKYFGRKLVASITWGDVERFKRERLALPTWRGDERTVACVNRELSILRRIFSVARMEGWIKKSPFEAGKNLIEVSHEVKRDRILTAEEEARLIAACAGKRAHLRPIIICALETGMRQGEIFTLIASDVNLPARLISIRSTHTKTQQARQVPISRKLLAELESIIPSRSPSELVFGITDSVKRSFAYACKTAHISALRFHDLRHTAATRWIQAGIPVTTVSRLLGHSDLKTTYRYVNPTPQMLTDVLSVFDSHLSSHSEPNNGEQAARM